MNPECKNLEWIARQMYCPNCGTVITSYQQGNMTKFECPRCRTVSVRSYKSRRQDVIVLTITSQSGCVIPSDGKIRIEIDVTGITYDVNKVVGGSIKVK